MPVLIVALLVPLKKSLHTGRNRHHLQGKKKSGKEPLSIIEGSCPKGQICTPLRREIRISFITAHRMSSGAIEVTYSASGGLKRVFVS